MCGILGFYTKNETKEFNLLQAMNQKIFHRGPDQSGYFIENNLYLAHQRLSIHDLSDAGSQPMQSHCGNYLIVFNGEIYNFKELKTVLENKKTIFWRGFSDTEILMEFFVEFGLEKTLRKLDGMFSFAIYDRKNSLLHIARDRFGEKPLYFYSNNSEFCFSSEIKPLELFTTGLTLNQSAISYQLMYSYIPDSLSIYNEISKLLPGHYFTIDLNSSNFTSSINQVQYWSALKTAINLKENSIPMSNEDSFEYVERVLEKSVIDRMSSDVPLGAFLSGGIDSSCIVSLMQKNSTKKINTFSIGFHDDDFNEAHYAKKVSEVLGTEHHELYLNARDILECVPNISTIYDEPFSDSSQLPTFMVSKFSKSKVTVALTGDAGDELFGGYNRHILSNSLSSFISNHPSCFRDLYSKALKFPSPSFYNTISKIINISTLKKISLSDLANKAVKLSNVINAKNNIDFYRKLTNTGNLNYANVVIPDIESNEIFSCKQFSIAEQMMLQDTIGYLRNDILTKVDRASMASSLETRVPFLGNEVFEAAWSIPLSAKINSKKGKLPIRHILSKYVPVHLFDRPKSGFAVPIHEWLRGDLKDWAESLLTEDSLNSVGFLNVGEIRKSWFLHKSGKINCQYELWNILMFLQWYKSKRN